LRGTRADTDEAVADLYGLDDSMRDTLTSFKLPAELSEDMDEDDVEGEAAEG